MLRPTERHMPRGFRIKPNRVEPLHPSRAESRDREPSRTKTSRVEFNLQARASSDLVKPESSPDNHRAEPRFEPSQSPNKAEPISVPEPGPEPSRAEYRVEHRADFRDEMLIRVSNKAEPIPEPRASSEPVRCLRRAEPSIEPC